MPRIENSTTEDIQELALNGVTENLDRINPMLERLMRVNRLTWIALAKQQHSDSLADMAVESFVNKLSIICSDILRHSNQSDEFMREERVRLIPIHTEVRRRKYTLNRRIAELDSEIEGMQSDLKERRKNLIAAKMTESEIEKTLSNNPVSDEALKVELSILRAQLDNYEQFTKNSNEALLPKDFKLIPEPKVSIPTNNSDFNSLCERIRLAKSVTI